MDEDYRHDSAEDSDVERELRSKTDGSRLTASEKGKGRAAQRPTKIPKAKEIYSWEESYTRSWDAVQEDEDGSLQQAVGEFVARNRRKRLQAPKDAVRRTIIRHMVLILDLSASMMDRDMRPNRFDLSLEYAREFVTEWFDQNPLGQIGIIGMKDGLAERICGLSGNPPEVLKTIADRRALEPSGEPSLQNAIDMAGGSMSHLPTHSSREVLIIFGSLTTCDPGNIHDTLRRCIEDKIRVSVVALAAEMKICRDFCTETGGIFGVALNEGHFHDMLFEHVPPPAMKLSVAPKLISNGNGAAPKVSTGDLMMMGFPTRLPGTGAATLCVCHGIMKSDGYICPRCSSKVCDVPTDCNICGMVIVSAPHLARSYHHLFPVKPYQPVKEMGLNEDIALECNGCGTVFPLASHILLAGADVSDGLSRLGRYRCPQCRKDYCSECDVFVHDVLHVCPTCTSKATIMTTLNSTMSAVVPIRIAQATETTPKVHYRLLELSPDLCKLIETPSTQLVLTIKGKEGDDAVLCTANKTYALRSVNISNSLMIVNGPKSNEALANDGIFINDEIHEVMETVPMVPKLDRLYGMLRGSEYGEDEEDRMDEDDVEPDHSSKQPYYTRKDLHQVIQASDEEFDHAIKTNHILELNGFLRPLPPKHLTNILIKIFNSIVAHGLPRSGIPIKDLEEALESDYEIPRSVSRQVIEWYGGVEGDKWVMNENKALRQAGLGLLRPYAHTPIKSEQFLSIWRDAVGDVFADQVELPLLRGNYLLHPGSSVRDEHMVTFFSRAELSTDPLTRFNELFLTRQKWLEGDIIAFIEDLGVDKKDCDRLLLKFARRSADRGGTPTSSQRRMPISKDAVNAVRERLSELQTGHGNITLILERLSSLETASNDQVALQKAWDEVSPDLAKLVHDDKVLDGKIYDSLAQEIASHGITLTPQENLEEFKRVAQQLLEQINAMDNDISDILMPAAKGELREGVNAAFTLRALSLHPRRALPAGKTLLSLFMKENDDRSEQEKQKEKQINDIVKKAYWDAALEQVSSPSPDIQIPRLKVFYHDLFSALKPFISREHPVMVALSSPLSPSSNHLASALNYLILALNLMKSVCAPIHDNDIDETLAKLENIHKLHVPRETLAEEYISGMKFALHMGQTIADDYQSFMLKYGDESNIAAMLRGSAREQEREVIVGLFGQEKISRLWKRWKGSDSGVWTDKLLDVVGSLEPLMASPDLLPPPLIMSRVDLAEAQTLFLGLIITASIRSLVPQLSPGRLSVLYRDNQDALQKEATFTERLWTLIGADPFANDHATTESDLDGIVEEVVSLWRMRNPDASGDTLTKETELRDMTRQIINQEAHPVRELLKKRLLDGLKQRIAQPIIPREKASGPNHISAGRALKPVARLKPSKGFPSDQPEADLLVTGIGDPAFRVHMRHILHILRMVQSWVESTWNDILVL